MSAWRERKAVRHQVSKSDQPQTDQTRTADSDETTLDVPNSRRDFIKGRTTQLRERQALTGGTGFQPRATPSTQTSARSHEHRKRGDNTIPRSSPSDLTLLIDVSDEEQAVEDEEEEEEIDRRPAESSRPIGSSTAHRARDESPDDQRHSDNGSVDINADELRQIEYILGQEVAMFLRLRSDDFQAIQRFMDLCEKLLDLPYLKLLDIYSSIISRTGSSLSWKVLERIVILKECQARSGLEYLEPLIFGKRVALEEHRSRVDAIYTAIQHRFVKTSLAQRSASIPESFVHGVSSTSRVEFTQPMPHRRTESGFSRAPTSAVSQRRRDPSSDGDSVFSLDMKSISGDPQFKLYQSKQELSMVFGVGSIFAMPWHETFGETAQDQSTGLKSSSQNSSTAIKVGGGWVVTGAMGSQVYSNIRRFTVVRSRDTHCICVPITSYGGKGLSRKKISRSEQMAHAIVYTQGAKPTLLAAEPNFIKGPICVRLLREERLAPTARIHFGKFYTVEYNVKVKHLGAVITRDRQALINNAREEMFGNDA